MQNNGCNSTGDKEIVAYEMHGNAHIPYVPSALAMSLENKLSCRLYKTLDVVTASFFSSLMSHTKCCHDREEMPKNAVSFDSQLYIPPLK